MFFYKTEKMSKKIIKYTGRIVWGILTVLFGIATYFELTPVGDGPCEAGQKGPYPIRLYLCIGVTTIILLCVV